MAMAYVVEMGIIRFVLSDELEKRLRSHVRKKGDLSRMGEEAIREYLDRLCAREEAA